MASFSFFDRVETTVGISKQDVEPLLTDLKNARASLEQVAAISKNPATQEALKLVTANIQIFETVLHPPEATASETPPEPPSSPRLGG